MENKWKSIGPINCLLIDVLQNIFFCVQLSRFKLEFNLFIYLFFRKGMPQTQWLELEVVING